MSTEKVYRAIGCMSGTSADGIDLTLIETDGRSFINPIEFCEYAYSAEERQLIKSAFGKKGSDKNVQDLVTQKHIQVLKEFDQKADIIGFHGQTIFHDPDHALSIQIGDPQEIANELSTPVIGNLRQNDMKHGGQGAPLLPLYHFSKLAGVREECVVLNMGGVGNITYIGETPEELIAFDTGPANALIDDYCKMELDFDYDAGGFMASTGEVIESILEAYMNHPYFEQPVPKSLDRDMWSIRDVQKCDPEDALATLTAFSVKAVEEGLKHIPNQIKHIYVTGGGRKNTFMMEMLSDIGPKVDPVEVLGWNGDTIEAEGFAYFAVRSILGLPITYPKTTGCSEPISGGVLYDPS